MIASRSLKRVLAEIALVAGALLTLGAVLLATRVISFSSTSADPASALHEVAELPAEADDLVSWAPDAWHRERRLEPATRVAIEAAYVRAWAALGVYQSTGETPALTALFSGPARLDALAVPAGQSVATWSVSHRLRLEFYALDGATVALSDVAAQVVRTVGAGSGEAVLDSDEKYSVVMVLEDGYWRIRHLLRGAGSTTTVVTRSATGATTITGPGTTLTGRGARTPIPAAAFNGTDYSPVGWPDTPAATVTADLTRVRDLGLNAVRVRVPFPALTGQAGLARLPDLLGAAQHAGVAVILVLFDDLTDLSPASWAAADHDVAALVAAAGTGAPVALWDLADRPDLRSAAASRTEISAFVDHEAGVLHTLAPTTPLTVSWADAAAAADPAMVALVDVVSVHPPDPAADLPTDLERVQRSAGTRPVMLVASTTATDGGWSPVPHSERRQAAEVAQVMLDAQQSGVSRTVIDQLQDVAADRHGLLRADFTGKPAAALVRPGAPLSPVAGNGLVDYLAARFWRVATVALLVVLLFAFRRRMVAIIRGWRRHRASSAPPGD